MAKMEATDTRAAGTGCRGRSGRMWSGMGAGVAHRAGWKRASMLRVSGIGTGSSVRTNAASGAGMGTGLGMCRAQAQAQEQCLDGRRI